jgi:SpoVK/Ycf46/Vps4 family AAA+-type ATPase
LGATKAATELQKALDGCIFIDEAYSLNPATNSEGSAIAMQLLDAANKLKDKLTIILAGYKDDIEKLIDFNIGFQRRFPFVLKFEDYTDAELGTIFENVCTKHNWRVASPNVVAVAARRIGRRRGPKFGNAGDMQVLFEAAYRQAMMRENCNETLIVEDIVGPPPIPDLVPDLKNALEELDDTIALDAVKAKIHQLVKLAKINYDRDLAGEAPYEVPLNRVFFGNPGTGKTTVAKLYGRILKGLGMLSDGDWEMKQPKDLMGSAVGETEKITAKLIERCKGKILIIDEAYGLHGCTYGKAAIDTLVGLVHNAPGEDIAVVMIGYEKDMRKMCRESNAGLTRRLSLDDPFVFEDYTDRELERIALQSLQRSNLIMSAEICRLFIKSISAQRFAPNFGNAGAVITAIATVKTRLANRDEFARDVTIEDLGITQNARDPLDALEGLFKVEHIAEEVRKLKSVIAMCSVDNKDPIEHLKNYILVGNPGTGKSTFADILAGVLYELGLLGRNHVVRRSGLDMQGSYVGQTKDTVNLAMAEAQGGVLFIDEAYTLGGHAAGQYSKEAVDQLVGLMTEKEHLHRTVVILAGYPKEMNQMLATNQGLRSRFTGMIEFPDWDASDCVKYITQQCTKEGFTIEPSGMRALQSGLLDMSRRQGWANARDCVVALKGLYSARATRCSVDVTQAALKVCNTLVFLILCSYPVW